MSASIIKRYCNVKELAAYTGVPEGTLYDWSLARIIPSIKIGKRVLFDLKDIDQVMERLKRDPVPEDELITNLDDPA